MRDPGLESKQKQASPWTAGVDHKASPQSATWTEHARDAALGPRQSPLRSWQRAMGNQAVVRTLQTKLTVSEPGDIYEQEADRRADQVMRLPDPALPSPSSSTGLLQRKCESCSEEDEKEKDESHETLSRKPLNPSPPVGGTAAPANDTASQDRAPADAPSIGFRSSCGTVVARQVADPDDGIPFDDDPLSARGFGEASTRVRPGPVRSTLIRSSSPPQGPIDCGSLFESRQIAAFGGPAGPWKLNELTRAIVTTLTTCELACVSIYVVPKPDGADPRGEAMKRAETVRKRVMEWIGPGRFSEDRFETGLSSGSDDGAEVTVYLNSRPRVLSRGNTGGGPSRNQPRPDQPKVPKSIQGWQNVLAAGGQITWHASLATGKPAATPQDATLQFQAARNFAAHPENESGPELQGIVQFGYNVTTKQPSIASGFQYTEVISLLGGLLQISGFVQLVLGVQAGRGSVSGQIQPSSGVQAVVQVGKAQIGVMIFRGLTIAPGDESTQDTGGNLGLQFNF